MFDWDVIIIGGGPAGLTAGLYLARAKRRVLLLDKDGFGGYLKNIELIENYPGFSEGISGAGLASEMISQAKKYGLGMENAEVTGIEAFSSTRWVNCANGGYSADIIIIAGGSKHKKLGVPGEDAFLNKGVINCAFCDGGQFSGQAVAVCGGGDSGVTEALYMSKIANEVILIEAESEITATAILREKAYADPKVKISTGTKILEIAGNDKVESIIVENTISGTKNNLPVNGVLVQTGLLPNTDYLHDIIPLDEHGSIIVNHDMETQVQNIFAAGDLRSNSPRQVASAVGDGTIAGISAEKRLLKTA